MIVTAPLDAEVQALKAEIDRVANTTQFNSQNLLTAATTPLSKLVKAGQTVGLEIGSVQTKDLGMGASSGGGESIVGARIDTTNAVHAGDVKINGQEVGAIAASADMEKVLEAINNNVDNVVALPLTRSSQERVTVLPLRQFDIASKLGQGTATTFNISASQAWKSCCQH